MGETLTINRDGWRLNGRMLTDDEIPAVAERFHRTFTRLSEEQAQAMLDRMAARAVEHIELP